MSNTSNSPPDSPSPPTPPNLHQNSSDPSVTWIVQKYGGTSVGKFAAKISEDIVPRYLDQHRVAIVCSARSGSTKALGTTNLLLRAASEALQNSNKPTRRGVTSGTVTPGATLPLSLSYSPPTATLSRARSLSSGKGFPRSSTPSPFTPTQVPSTPPTAPIEQPLEFPIPAFYATVDLIRQEHIIAARNSVRDPDLLADLEVEIESDCEGLKGFLDAAQIIDEISPRSRDSIVGVGEKLACKLVATILRDRGIDSEVISLENIVSTDEGNSSSADEGGQLSQDFYDRVSLRLGERIRQCGPRVPVITGFFGPVPGSLLRQIGRGYTDLLAALLAVGLEASELQIWKEVDGIFTADPRKVPTARLIPIISPEEAAELTYYGSEVIHPFTMEQVIRRKIPIRIKNVENPLGGGTVIHPDPDLDATDASVASSLSSSPTPAELIAHHTNSLSSAHSLMVNRKLPTAVTYKENIVVISVNSNRKTISHGFLAKLFGTLDKFGVVVDLISTSEVHVSMAIEDTLERRVFDRLLAELRKSGTVSIHPHMVILSLVGKQMKNMVGIAGKMFTALAEGNVNLEMISQGASEINISCVIDEKDAVKALNLIHQTCLQIKPEGARGIVGQWLF